MVDGHEILFNDYEVVSHLLLFDVCRVSASLGFDRQYSNPSEEHSTSVAISQS